MPGRDTCNGCGGLLGAWLTMPIDAKKNELTPYASVLRCADCGLGVLDPLPEPDVIPAFYELDLYYTHGEGHIAQRPASVADRLLTKLAWLADRARPFEPVEIAALLPANGKICDLGCGHAGYLREFKRLGFDVIGVDPDPAARAEAAKADILVEPGTAEVVPDSVSSGTFDLVIMTHALEHCRDPRMALDNAVRLTKPGGYCYIEVPNCSAVHFRTFTICSEMFDAPRHIYFFAPDNLKAMMMKVGLAPVSLFYHGFVRHFNQSWRFWEATIADRVAAVAPRRHPRRHDLQASVALFLRSFWRKPTEKYDSFGWLMRRLVR
jgi:SAM-dependent methyltransferase